MTDVAALLRRAEDRLRARGLTGAQAFDVLLPALDERIGRTPLETPTALARELVADWPTGPGVDLFGLAYERFFADLFKGLRGQFFTPAPIARLLVERLDPGPDDVVLDPTCGSGGLLVVAARTGARVRGIELDPRLARLADINLGFGGAEPRVACADFFAAEPVPVDVIVANPPFSVDVDDAEVLARYDAGRGRTRVSSDRLFLEAIERWVRPGGRAGIVVPYSILANPTWADVRDRIERHWHRTAICTLPEGVFRPFGGAAGRAVLLWLERRGSSPRIAVGCAFAQLADPGYDVRNKRFRPTSTAEVDARCGGDGFVPLAAGRWTPEQTSSGVPLDTVARVRSERVVPARLGPRVALADLADADRTTGELHPRELDPAEILGVRNRISAGDVLVAQLRPNLGNVAVAPHSELPLVGSPEWIVLAPIRAGHMVLHALRTPTWRDRLPLTQGQTRPRTSPDQLAQTAVPWPRDDVADRVDQLSSRLFAARARVRSQLAALQVAVDGFAAGELDDDQLLTAVAAIDRQGDPEDPEMG